MSGLKDRVAIVTGSGGSMGGAIARRLASAGAAVVVNDRHSDRTDRIESELRSRGTECAAVTADVSCPEGAERLIASAIDAWGRLDILVNVVGGIKGPISAPVWEITDEQWDRTLRVNLDSTFHCTKRALVPMMEQRSGHIVNIASTQWAGAAAHAHYAAAKAGVVSFTRSVAQQVGPLGIRVNAVAPGGTLTNEKVRSALSRAGTDRSTLNPLGRLNEPEDIAHAVFFLVGDEARNISGQLLTVAGGLNPSL